jgi:hypothetical protein
MADVMQKIATLDRRWVFLAIAVVVTVPFFVPMGLDIEPTEKTRQAFEAVNSLKGTGKPLMISMDYGPETMAELQPMADTVIMQAFHQDIPVIGMTFIATGVGLAEQALNESARRFEEQTGRKKEYGKDFVFLGFKPYAFAPITQIGENFAKAYPTDFRGTKKEDLEILRNVHTYADIGLVMDIAGNSMPATWISYAVGRYDARFTMGVTAVMAADYYPYVQSGQSEGIVGGMRGAAEYEVMALEAGFVQSLGAGSRGMDSQSWTHIVIILFIIVGNVAYFASRRKDQG